MATLRSRAKGLSKFRTCFCLFHMPWILICIRCLYSISFVSPWNTQQGGERMKFGDVSQRRTPGSFFVPNISDWGTTRFCIVSMQIIPVLYHTTEILEQHVIWTLYMCEVNAFCYTCVRVAHLSIRVTRDEMRRLYNNRDGIKSEKRMRAEWTKEEGKQWVSSFFGSWRVCT